MNRFGKPILYVLLFMLIQVVVSIAATVWAIATTPTIRDIAVSGDSRAVTSALLSTMTDGGLLSGAMVVSSVVTILVMIWPFGDFKLKRDLKPSGIGGKMSVVAVVGTMMGAVALDIVSEFMDLPDLLSENMEGMIGGLMGCLVVGVIAPIAEEVVFRSAILGYMLRKGVDRWTAIIISALLFGLMHLNPAQMPFAAAVGVMLGMIYYKTGNIILTSLIHILNNSLSVVLMKTMGADYTMGDIFGGTLGVFAVLCVSSVACVYLFKYFWKNSADRDYVEIVELDGEGMACERGGDEENGGVKENVDGCEVKLDAEGNGMECRCGGDSDGLMVSRKNEGNIMKEGEEPGNGEVKSEELGSEVKKLSWKEKYGKPILAMLTFIGVQLAVSVLLMVAYIIYKKMSGQEVSMGNLGNEMSVSITSAALFLSSLVTIVLMIWPFRMFKADRDLKPSGLGIGYVILAVAGAMAGSVALNIIVSLLDVPDLLQQKMPNLAKSFLGALSIGIVSPVTEEIVFRAAMLGYMLRKGVGVWKSIIIASLLFGLVHMNPAQVVFATMLGLIFCIIYYKTGNILLTILVHVINNSFAVFTMIIAGDNVGDEKLNASVPVVLAAIMAGAFCIFALRVLWTDVANKKYVGED